MESSSGPTISPLLRPRVLSAVIITATAAVSIGAGIWYESWRQSRAQTAELPSGNGLHRRNAVRRTRRTSLVDGANGTAGEPQTTANDDSLALAPPTDENAVNTLSNVRPLNNGGNGEDRDVTVVDDGEDDPWLDDVPAINAIQRVGHNIVNLLFRVSEDNARRSAYVHRGCACNACGIVPIRGIRYRCANCADFDLCETCESQGLHIKTHIFYKVKVPAPPFGPRQMQPVWYTGDPDGFPRSLPKSLIARLSRETGFERQELEAFWEQWTYMANTEWREDPDNLGLAMDRKTFERCLVPSGGYRHAAPNLIHDRMFAFYDTNNDGLIGFSEFLHGLSYRKRKDKLRKIFEGYDTDRDGLVSRRDFLRFFRAYYVLYKQMHKDILEGLDDQVMSSIETHQLVGNRQPVSSFFGREGRLPHADIRRMMGGKYIDHALGEVRVADGVEGVVAEDKPDMVDREELLSLLYTRSEIRINSAGIFEERYFTSGDNSGDEHDDGPAVVNYWDALLNPPRTVQELPDLLTGRNDPSGLNDGIFVSTEHNEYEQGDDSAAMGLTDGQTTTTPAAEDDQVVPVSSEPTASGENNEHDAPETTPRATQSTFAGRGEGVSQLDASTPEQQEAITNNSRIRNNMWRAPTTGQMAAREEAFVRAHLSKAAKVTARRKLHNRWMRRQFYLDEEEGANAPGGWTDDKDLLAHMNPAEPDAGESSSKVRFAEDTAASGKKSTLASIPESERDAGREVLYQVMQQAFNELLDILFLKKENIAIEAAKTQRYRRKYRHLFETIDVSTNGASHGDILAEATSATTTAKEAAKAATANKPLVDQTLEEMLAQAGYEVIGEIDNSEVTSRQTNGEAATSPDTTNVAETAVVAEVVEEKDEKETAASSEVVNSHDEKSDAENVAAEDTAEPTAEETANTKSDAESAAGSPSANILIALDEVPAISLTPVAAAAGPTHADYRDPTLPQFRPNTEAEYAAMLQTDLDVPSRTPSQEASLVAVSTAATIATSSEGRSTPGTTTPSVEDPSAAVDDEEEEVPKNKDKGKGKEEDGFSTLAENGHAAAAKEDDDNEGDDEYASAPPDPATLVRWKRLELAEREAQARGGWGKLSYDEFESIFKQEELSSNRLDYLGSWIDFCIP
ncbi:hypothetical protein SEUCBS139899_007973 [Sporothrix eucalyptigena]